jgi:hypothetical protein
MKLPVTAHSGGSNLLFLFQHLLISIILVLYPSGVEVPFSSRVVTCVHRRSRHRDLKCISCGFVNHGSGLDLALKPDGHFDLWLECFGSLRWQNSLRSDVNSNFFVVHCLIQNGRGSWLSPEEEPIRGSILVLCDFVIIPSFKSKAIAETDIHSAG